MENKNGVPPQPCEYTFNCGVESEAAGRSLTKGFVALRKDLAALPLLLATSSDVVRAPPQRAEFLAQLGEAGLVDLPTFQLEETPTIALASRPFGVIGDHLRRSNVAKYREDVALCRSLDEARDAAERFGPRFVMKAEYSSSGLGVLVCDGGAAALRNPSVPAARWVANRLRQDGVFTLEPWLDIIVELSGEFLEGQWNGVSQCMVEHCRWQGQWLGPPGERLDREVHDFIYTQRAVETKLRSLNLVATCGVATCGADVAIVRREDTGALDVRVLEVNARTTMSHYALAAKRRVPRARTFEVLQLSELAARAAEPGAELVYLTDPTTASMFCAVLDCRNTTLEEDVSTTLLGAPTDDEATATVELALSQCGTGGGGGESAEQL